MSRFWSAVFLILGIVGCSPVQIPRGEPTFVIGENFTRAYDELLSGLQDGEWVREPLVQAFPEKEFTLMKRCLMGRAKQTFVNDVLRLHHEQFQDVEEMFPGSVFWTAYAVEAGHRLQVARGIWHGSITPVWAEALARAVDSEAPGAHRAVHPYDKNHRDSAYVTYDSGSLTIEYEQSLDGQSFMPKVTSRYRRIGDCAGIDGDAIWAVAGEPVGPAEAKRFLVDRLQEGTWTWTLSWGYVGDDRQYTRCLTAASMEAFWDEIEAELLRNDPPTLVAAVSSFRPKLLDRNYYRIGSAELYLRCIYGYDRSVTDRTVIRDVAITVTPTTLETRFSPDIKASRSGPCQEGALSNPAVVR